MAGKYGVGHNQTLDGLLKESVHCSRTAFKRGTNPRSKSHGQAQKDSREGQIE